MACGLCYRDALVGRKCSGKCGRPHFASLTAVPAPCGQILRSFIAQTRGVSLTKPSTGGGDGRKRGRDSYDDDRYNDDRRDPPPVKRDLVGGTTPTAIAIDDARMSAPPTTAGSDEWVGRHRGATARLLARPVKIVPVAPVPRVAEAQIDDYLAPPRRGLGHPRRRPPAPRRCPSGARQPRR